MAERSRRAERRRASGDTTLQEDRHDTDRSIRILIALLATFAADALAQPTQSAWQAASGLRPDEVCPAWNLVDTALGAQPVLGNGKLVLQTTAPDQDHRVRREHDDVDAAGGVRPHGAGVPRNGALPPRRARRRDRRRRGRSRRRELKLGHTLDRATTLAGQGSDACATNDAKTASRRMKQTQKLLQKMSRRLRGLAARKASTVRYGRA
jgi:hypothetical protein